MMNIVKNTAAGHFNLIEIHEKMPWSSCLLENRGVLQSFRSFSVGFHFKIFLFQLIESNEDEEFSDVSIHNLLNGTSTRRNPSIWNDVNETEWERESEMRKFVKMWSITFQRNCNLQHKHFSPLSTETKLKKSNIFVHFLWNKFKWVKHTRKEREKENRESGNGEGGKRNRQKYPLDFS